MPWLGLFEETVGSRRGRTGSGSGTNILRGWPDQDTAKDTAASIAIENGHRNSRFTHSKC